MRGGNTTVRTACTYDCPDACGLQVGLEDGRPVSLSGDPRHPVTRGFVCYRIHRHLRRLGHAERVTRPRLREGARWREIEWEAALDLLAERLGAALAEDGPPSVVLLRGGGSLGLSKELVGHWFHRLGPVTTARGGPCGEAGEEAQVLDFGTAADHDYTDLEHASAVVLWGKNPVATGPHLVPFVAGARRRGAPVVLIDPLPVESARLADRTVRVRPSGDGWLALAVLRRLYDRGAVDERARARVENLAAFERLLLADEQRVAACAARAGVPLEEVEALAELYAARRPVATWIGWGVQRRLSGGRNVRCIDALALLSGNVGCPGGGANFTSFRRRGLDATLLARPSGRTIATPTLARDLAALSAPPARVVYIAGANPVTQLPDSAAVAAALAAVDFVVVADAFFTDTARAATLFLPVRLMLEEDDIVGSYQHHHLAVAPAVCAPPDGARGDLDILVDLDRRLGRAPDPLLADPRGALARLCAPWFRDGPPWAAAAPRRNPAQSPVPFAERFATPSGLARLLVDPPALSPAREGYPLLLLSLASRRWQTSQLFEAEQHHVPPVECRLHPRAAAGLADGARARLSSPLGTSLAVTLRLDARLHEDLCVVPRGGWVACGRGVNLLVEARLTDLGEGAAFYDQRVRLEPG